MQALHGQLPSSAFHWPARRRGSPEHAQPSVPSSRHRNAASTGADGISDGVLVVFKDQTARRQASAVRTKVMAGRDRRGVPPPTPANTPVKHAQRAATVATGAATARGAVSRRRPLGGKAKLGKVKGDDVILADDLPPSQERCVVPQLALPTSPRPHTAGAMRLGSAAAAVAELSARARAHARPQTARRAWRPGGRAGLASGGGGSCGGAYARPSTARSIGHQRGQWVHVGGGWIHADKVRPKIPRRPRGRCADTAAPADVAAPKPRPPPPTVHENPAEVERNTHAARDWAATRRAALERAQRIRHMRAIGLDPDADRQRSSIPRTTKSRAQRKAYLTKLRVGVVPSHSNAVGKALGGHGRHRINRDAMRGRRAVRRAEEYDDPSEEEEQRGYEARVRDENDGDDVWRRGSLAYPARRRTYIGDAFERPTVSNDAAPRLSSPDPERRRQRYKPGGRVTEQRKPYTPPGRPLSARNRVGAPPSQNIPGMGLDNGLIPIVRDVLRPCTAPTESAEFTSESAEFTSDVDAETVGDGMNVKGEEEEEGGERGEGEETGSEDEKGEESESNRDLVDAQQELSSSVIGDGSSLKTPATHFMHVAAESSASDQDEEWTCSCGFENAVDSVECVLCGKSAPSTMDVTSSAAATVGGGTTTAAVDVSESADDEEYSDDNYSDDGFET